MEALIIHGFRLHTIEVVKRVTRVNYHNSI